MKSSHWFFTNSNTFLIWTYALGDHPSNSHQFDNQEDFDLKVQQLIEDGYEFIRDQSK
jgi:hypothetical protein